MKTTRFYTLLALLLMMGGVTMQAQTEDDFWMGIDPPATGILSLIEDADGNIIVGATGVYSSSDGGATWSLIGLENSGILRLYEHTDGTLLAGTNYGGHPLQKREAGSTVGRTVHARCAYNNVPVGILYKRENTCRGRVNSHPKVIFSLRLHRHPSHHQQERKQGVKSCRFHIR